MTNQQKIAAAKAGVDMFAPARAQAAGLELMSEDGGAVEVEIVSSSTACRIPASVDTKDHSEDVTYEGGKLSFRATDTDSERNGWTGTIPQLVESRTRLVFSDPRDVAKVAYKPSADIDVTVTYSDALHTRPALIIVEKIY